MLGVGDPKPGRTPGRRRRKVPCVLAGFGWGFEGVSGCGGPSGRSPVDRCFRGEARASQSFGAQGVPVRALELPAGFTQDRIRAGPGVPRSPCPAPQPPWAPHPSPGLGAPQKFLLLFKCVFPRKPRY